MSRGRILIVDDERASVKLIAGWLSQMGYEIETADCGRKAVEKSLETPPDVVIMDIKMPEMDGYEACRRIKSEPETMSARIIMVTQLNDRESRIKALSSGASEFLSKPVDRSELSIRVKNLLAIKASEDFLLHRNKILEEDLRQKITEIEEAFVKAKNTADSPVAAAVKKFCAAGEEHLEAGAYEAALSEFNKAVAVNPDNAEVYMKRARVYVRMNNMQSAVEEYNRAVLLEPAGKRAYSNRGQCFIRMGNYEDAADDFTKTLEIDPLYINAYISRSIAYRNMGEPGLAVKDCNSALDIDPANAKAYNSRGNAHVEERRVDEALRDFSRAVELDPGFAVAYLNRGNVHLARREFEKALEDYSKALESDPLYAAAYKKRGAVHVRNGDYNKALDDYTSAIDIDGDDSDARYLRGMLYVEMGDHRSALQDLSRVKEAGGASAEIDQGV